MQIAFLMIITFLGIVYAFFVKKTKIALGLVVLLVSLALQIPNLATGFWSDVLQALSLIVFALAIFAIVYEKKVVSSFAKAAEDKKDVEDKESKDEKAK